MGKTTFDFLTDHPFSIYLLNGNGNVFNKEN